VSTDDLSGCLGMWLKAIVEALYPTRCAGCDFPGELICDACHAAIGDMRPQMACTRCGAPYGAMTCTECWDSTFAFSQAICVGSLERPLSRVVTMYKDAMEVRLAPIVAELLSDALRSFRPWAEALVPIPASSKAISRRGFDHVDLIAEHLASAWRIPAIRALRMTAISDQRRLGREARRVNITEAIRTYPGIEVPDRVLVLDDVITTGATADAAASVLMAQGCEEVRVGALARAW